MRTKLLYTLFLIAVLSSTVRAQTPLPVKTVFRLEVEPNDKADLILVDPQGAAFEQFGSVIFVETAAVKGGVIRVVQSEKGQPPKWYVWRVGPPSPPTPIVLPTAKLTAEPASIKAIGDQVTLTWETTNAEKVELDGEAVEPTGSKVILQQLPTALYTLKVSSADHTVYAQAVVSIGELPPPVLSPTTKVTRVTYVWQKDKTAIPRQVAAAMNKINADSMGAILASEFEVDTVNGQGQIPEQYKIAHDEAVKAGVPCLVVQAGGTVLRVLKTPTTTAEVLEAVK